jgi:hypothetical protein
VKRWSDGFHSRQKEELAMTSSNLLDWTLCPSVVARQQLGKHVPAVTKNCWRHRFLYGPCRIKWTCSIGSYQKFLSSIRMLHTLCKCRPIEIFIRSERHSADVIQFSALPHPTLPHLFFHWPWPWTCPLNFSVL